MNKWNYYIVKTLVYGIAMLPMSFLYVLSDILYIFMRYVIRYRKDTILANLRYSFPKKTEFEVNAVMSGFYHHLCDCIVEDIKLLHISDGELRKRVTVQGTELIEELARDGRSIIVMLGHYGNWEWVQEVTNRYSRPQLNAEIYRPAKNPLFNQLLYDIRSRFDTVQIPQKQAIRTLLRYNNQQQQFLVGFISDQRPNSKSLNHWINFLNQETAIAIGGEEIGRHIGAHFVYLDIEKPHRGHYVFTFKEIKIASDLAQEEYPLTKTFYRLFEETILRNPCYWLWSHKRWRIKRIINNHKQ